MKLVTQVGLGPGHIVLDGDPASASAKGAQAQFSAHICCGQMDGWIKMPLGGEVSLTETRFTTTAASAGSHKASCESSSVLQEILVRGLAIVENAQHRTTTRLGNDTLIASILVCAHMCEPGQRQACKLSPSHTR